MSVDDPQLPPSQQGISHNDPVQRPGEDSGKIKNKQSLTKKIRHKLAKLVPEKAKKLFSGHRGVQALFPKSVEATPGLKDSSARLQSVKSLTERNPQVVDVLPKLGGDQASLLQRRDSVGSFDSAFGEGDNWSLASTDSYASIRSSNSDDGYDSVRFNEPEFIDDENGYMTNAEINKNAPPSEMDLDGENQYDLPNNLKLDDAPDTPEINEEIRDTLETSTRDEGGVGETNPDGSNTGGDSEQGSSGEGQGQPDSSTDEPTITESTVKAEKYKAYEKLIDNDNYGALEKKLANTNNYQTARQVAQLALEKQGKDSFVFMIVQNRMMELRADQLFNQLGGYQVGADYNQIREVATETMGQSNHSPDYQAKVLELLNERLQEYEGQFGGMTPFSHLEKRDDAPPPVPPQSEELVEELASQESKAEDEPPGSTPLAKNKKRGRRFPGFLRRGR